MTTPLPSYVQVPPNSSGLKIRTVEVTDSAGNLVECQAIIIADPNVAANLAGVSSLGELNVTDDTQNVNMSEILGQLKRIALLLEIQTGQTVSLADVC